MTTPWTEIFGPLEDVVHIVVDVLREMDAVNSGVHSQKAVKRALALRLGKLKPQESPTACQKHAENMVANLQRQWTERAGLGNKAKDATPPDPKLLAPPWLAAFTAEWGRRQGSDKKWDLFRRPNSADFADLVKPTADPDELDRRVSQLMKVPLGIPAGEPNPSKTVGALQAAYERRPDVKAWVLHKSA
jgi:hypothetical protein